MQTALKSSYFQKRLRMLINALALKQWEYLDKACADIQSQFLYLQIHRKKISAC
jgi:hypothetical protein